MQEIVYALRRLHSSPIFTIAATLTLAIAIGATALVFNLVDGVRLKAFPDRNPDHLLLINGSPERQLPVFPVAPANYLDWRAQSRVFTGLAAASLQQFTVTGKQEPQRVNGLTVTPNYFSVIGVTPVLGRTLAPDSGGPAEVVIGYGYWQRRFGGAPSAVGQSLTLNDSLYTIVGVMPAGLLEPGAWTRLSFQGSQVTDRGSRYLGVFGRLKPGVTPEGARQAMKVIARRLAVAYPKTNENWTVRTILLVDQLTEKSGRRCSRCCPRPPASY